DTVLLDLHCPISRPDGKNWVALVRVGKFDGDRSRLKHVSDRYLFALAQGEESPFRFDVQGQRPGQVVADNKQVVVSHFGSPQSSNLAISRSCAARPAALGLFGVILAICS